MRIRLLIAAVSASALVLTGCQQKEQPLIVDDIVKSDGNHSFPYVEWHMTLEDFTEKNECELYNPYESYSGPVEITDYVDAESATFAMDDDRQFVELYGCLGQVRYQFLSNQLSGVEIRINDRINTDYKETNLEEYEPREYEADTPENYNDLAENLLSDLTRVLGSDYESGGRDTTSTYMWKQSRTDGLDAIVGLMVAKNDAGDVRGVDLNITVMPASWAPASQ